MSKVTPLWWLELSGIIVVMSTYPQGRVVPKIKRLCLGRGGGGGVGGGEGRGRPNSFI